MLLWFWVLGKDEGPHDPLGPSLFCVYSTSADGVIHEYTVTVWLSLSLVFRDKINQLL